MSEYERLTYYLDEQCTMLVMPQRKERIKKYIERLAELEDKIERGYMKEFLYRVDDKVYYADYRRFEIVEYIVIEICINKHDIIMKCRIADDSDYSIYHLKLEDVCQTKEDAEARLKELQEEKK